AEAPPAPIAGVEFTGEVVAAGDEVHGVAIGGRVMAMGSAAFAEYVAVDHRLVIPVPDALSDVQAACAPVALMTMHDALVGRGRLRAGETVLIQGASSSVGLVGLQIARHLGAAVIVGTSGSADKRARLADYGCTLALDGGAADLAQRVRDATQGQGVNLIVDMIGGPALPANVAAAALEARIVLVGRLGGARGELDIDAVAFKRLQLLGATFRSRTREQIQAIAQAVRADLNPLLAGGQLDLPVHCALPLADAAQAYALMRSNEHFGKIVLRP
ncbi:MAG: zinc-binding dehydrogenase, partial [Rubrivivax sp.]